MAGPVRALERRGQASRCLGGPCSQRNQHARGGRTVEQGAEQIGGGRIGPVEVIEQEHQRLLDRPDAGATLAQHGACGSARARPTRVRRPSWPTTEESARVPSERQRRAVAAAEDRAPRRSHQARPRIPSRGGPARARRLIRPKRRDRARPHGRPAQTAAGSSRCPRDQPARPPAANRPRAPSTQRQARPAQRCVQQNVMRKANTTPNANSELSQDRQARATRVTSLTGRNQGAT